MSVSVPIIIVVAVVGVFACVALIGTVIFLICRSKKNRQLEEMENVRMGHQLGGNVELGRIETYSPTKGTRRSSNWRIRGTRRARLLPIALSSKNDDYASSRDSIPVKIQSTASRMHRSRPGDSAATAFEGVDEIDLEDDGLDEAEVYLPAGAQVRSALTPISERDTPDSHKRGLPRQGYHLPGNPRGWRYLARQDRSSSPSWASDSSPKGSVESEPKGRGRSKSTPKKANVLRSFSFHTASPGPVPDGSLPPTPDAIYDACSRLSPQPRGKRSRSQHTKREPVQRPATTHTMTAIVDSKGSPALFTNRFASDIQGFSRTKGKPLDHDGSRAKQFNHQGPVLSSLRSPYFPEPSPLDRDDSCSSHRNSGGQDLRGSDSLSMSSQGNRQKMKHDAELRIRTGHVEQQIESWQNRHQAEYLTVPSSRKRSTSSSSEAKSAARGQSKRQILHESADVSNRQTSATSAPLRHPSNIVQSTVGKKDDEFVRRAKSVGTKPMKRDSVRALQVSRPSSVAASAILEDEVFNDRALRHSALLPEIDVASRKLWLSRPQSNLNFDPETELDTAIRSLTNSTYGDQSDSSAIWRLYEGSDTSLPYKPDQNQATPSTGSEEDSDHLCIPPENSDAHNPVKIIIRGHDHYDPHHSISSPQISDETYELKVIPPLRPRNSALSFRSTTLLPPPTRDSALHSSPPGSPGHRVPSKPTSHPPRQSTDHLISRYNARHQGQDIEEPQSRTFKPDEYMSLPHHPADFSNDPLPPPPPLVPTRSRARMTSMMMTLRRQNSESSRCDSTYFRLPQSERNSKASLVGPAQGHLLRSAQSREHSRSRRLGASEVATVCSGKDEAEKTESVGASAPVVSMGDIHGSSLLLRRAASKDIISDPFVERSNASRNSDEQTSPSKQATKSLSDRQISPRKAGSMDPESPETQLQKLRHIASAIRNDWNYQAKTQKRSVDLEQQIIGQAIERAKEPILTPELDQKSMSITPPRRTSLHREGKTGKTPSRDGLLENRASIDKTEIELSPVGKSIMAETRRDHHVRQKSGGSGSNHDFPTAPAIEHADTSATRPTTHKTQISQDKIHVSRHRRLNSSLSSIGVQTSPSRRATLHNRQQQRSPTQLSSFITGKHRRDKSSLSSISAATSNRSQDDPGVAIGAASAGSTRTNTLTGMSSGAGAAASATMADSAKARRESRRQRVSQLKERVASMESSRGKIAIAM